MIIFFGPVDQVYYFFVFFPRPLQTFFPNPVAANGSAVHKSPALVCLPSEPCPSSLFTPGPQCQKKVRPQLSGVQLPFLLSTTNDASSRLGFSSQGCASLLAFFFRFSLWSLQSIREGPPRRPPRCRGGSFVICPSFQGGFLAVFSFFRHPPPLFFKNIVWRPLLDRCNGLCSPP